MTPYFMQNRFMLKWAGPLEGEDLRGYVEPNPVVYGRLAALTRMTYEGLKVETCLKAHANPCRVWRS